MKFCIHIDIDKMYPMRLSNDIWDWLSFCRGSNSEKSETIAKWHLSSIEALPSARFWKSENSLISWTEWNIVIDFCVNIDILSKSSQRDCEMSFFIGLSFAELQILKKWKMALSFEPSWILWWNFAYTLVYWQDVAHEIVKWHFGFVEVLPACFLFLCVYPPWDLYPHLQYGTTGHPRGLARLHSSHTNN